MSVVATRVIQARRRGKLARVDRLIAKRDAQDPQRVAGTSGSTPRPGTHAERFARARCRSCAADRQRPARVPPYNGSWTRAFRPATLRSWSTSREARLTS